MPGAVLEILVVEGDRVERSQTVVVMESMKMEIAIAAPRNGVVRRVSVHPGQQVDRGMRLLEIAPEEDPLGSRESGLRNDRRGLAAAFWRQSWGSR